MILEGETASPRPVLATFFAKKEIIQTRWTIIIPNMAGMGFCTGPLLATVIETDTSSATIAEFKGMLIQDRTADFTVLELHPLYVRGLRREVGG